MFSDTLSNKYKYFKIIERCAHILENLFIYHVITISSLDWPEKSKRICQIQIDLDPKICFDFSGQSNDKIIIT